jgi:ornithine cyclodeaminase/alanine dehydrogenase-like protein (mu-crystallin family)
MTLLLTRSDVRALLTLDDCIAAVEEAFRLRGPGEVPPAGILGMAVSGGGFHIKAAIPGDRFAAKVNGNFSGNPQRGLPGIQGAIVLCDAANGRLLAIIDSIEITIQRTGAATAVAAKYLARPGSEVPYRGATSA